MNLFTIRTIVKQLGYLITSATDEDYKDILIALNAMKKVEKRNEQLFVWPII